MSVFRWLLQLSLRWWHAKQRQIDMEILWPAFRKHAPDLDHARAGFAMHAFDDPAWMSLGDQELIRMIGELH